jgi:DNA replication protein DnaC
LEEIKYDNTRNISKSQILKLSELNWLNKGENIIIIGSTGVGKSFLASAFGLKACMNGHKVNYFNSNKFFGELKYEKSCGNYYKAMTRISKKDLIILDDFGVSALLTALQFLRIKTQLPYHKIQAFYLLHFHL